MGHEEAKQQGRAAMALLAECRGIIKEFPTLPPVQKQPRRG